MSTTRRHLLQASIWAPVGASLAWLPTAQSAELFDLDSQALQQLAHKVVPVLPSSVCQSSVQTLSRQIGPLAGMQGQATQTALQLLHADDVAHARVHEVHGVTFSQTQIGILTALMRSSGGQS